MSERSSGSGARVIAILLVLLVGAIAVVAWLILRPDAPPPAPPRPVPPAETPQRSNVPQAPRPKSADTEHIVPEVPKVPDAQAPHEPEERDTVPLDVLVLASSGQPAPGATVLLLDPFVQHVAGQRPAELARAKTDDAGRARFEATLRTIRVYAWLGSEAGASDKLRPAEPKTDLTVRLAPAIAADGKVVDTTGAPVADAAVRFLASPWFGDAFGLLLETKSATDGTFELPVLPASAFDAAGFQAVIEARAKGWPLTRVAVTADKLREGEVVVTLERGAFLRGRFVRPTGEAVAGELVRTTDGRSQVTSDEGGRFELPLPRAGGVVLATNAAATHAIVLSGARPTSIGSGLRGAAMAIGWGAAKLVGRFRGDQGDIDLGDVTLSAGQPVKGVVVDSSGQPFKAADVALWLAGVAVAATQTDDAGKFELEGVGDDPHVLSATEAPGENAWTGRRRANVDDVKGGATDLRVVITGALTVVVKFEAQADRSPVVVPEVTLQAVATGGTPKSYGWTWAGSRIDSVRIEVERAGTYDVTVSLPGYEPATATGVEVSAEAEAKITVVFRKLP